jgi:hypothetical protein
MIVELRRLHDAMDRAVLDAYGWTAVRPVCEFLLDFEEASDTDRVPPHNVPHVIISITTTSADVAKLPPSSACVGILRLSFPRRAARGRAGPAVRRRAGGADLGFHRCAPRERGTHRPALGRWNLAVAVGGHARPRVR